MPARHPIARWVAWLALPAIATIPLWELLLRSDPAPPQHPIDALDSDARALVADVAKDLNPTWCIDDDGEGSNDCPDGFPFINQIPTATWCQPAVPPPLTAISTTPCGPDVWVAITDQITQLQAIDGGRLTGYQAVAMESDLPTQLILIGPDDGIALVGPFNAEVHGTFAVVARRQAEAETGVDGLVALGAPAELFNS